MTFGRAFSSLLATAAVGGCAVVALGMSHAASVADTTSSPDTASSVGAIAAGPSRTTRPAALPAFTPSDPAPPTSSTPVAVPRTTTTSTAAPTHVTTPKAAAVTTPARPATSPVLVRRTSAVAPAPRPVTHAPAPAPRPTPVRVASVGQALPLRFSTGTATRVITVVGRSYGGTTATLQAWDKVYGGWRKVGTPMTAHIGADGMSTQASEYRSATPIGSFTLTQAFGHNSDPGTNLPYLHTNANDWWISQAGPLYNTHQRCAYSCGFNRGSPNEHLYYETPYYNYAVVIDYNTRNAPGGVRAGRGSAFFLHVTDGRSTAGCVAVPQSRLITLMRWLTPSAHPRILIGVA